MRDVQDSEDPYVLSLDLDHPDAPARLVRLSTLTQREQRILKELRTTDPRNWPEPFGAWYRSVRLGPPAYFVVAEPLLEGAVAQIIRDPSATVPRIIVVSSVTVNDEILFFAQSVLGESEVCFPELTEVHVITLWGDHRIRRVAQSGTVTATFRYKWLGGPLGRDSAELLERAREAPEVRLDPIGVGRLLLGRHADQG